MCIHKEREKVRMTAIRAIELVLRLGKDPYVEDIPANQSQLRLSPLANRNFDLRGVNMFMVGPHNTSGVYHVMTTMTCLGHEVGAACRVNVTAHKIDDDDKIDDEKEVLLEVQSVEVDVYVDGVPLSRRAFTIYVSESPNGIILDPWGSPPCTNHYAVLSR